MTAKRVNGLRIYCLKIWAGIKLDVSLDLCCFLWVKWSKLRWVTAFSLCSFPADFQNGRHNCVIETKMKGGKEWAASKLMWIKFTLVTIKIDSWWLAVTVKGVLEIEHIFVSKMLESMVWGSHPCGRWTGECEMFTPNINLSKNIQIAKYTSGVQDGCLRKSLCTPVSTSLDLKQHSAKKLTWYRTWAVSGPTQTQIYYFRP